MPVTLNALSLKLRTPRSQLLRLKTCGFVVDNMEEQDYTWIIIVTLVGFFALAALLLVPIYRFLVREEKASKAWTKKALEEAAQEKNG